MGVVVPVLRDPAKLDPSLDFGRRIEDWRQKLCACCFCFVLVVNVVIVVVVVPRLLLYPNRLEKQPHVVAAVALVAVVTTWTLPQLLP